jgi:hypothetical protein
MCLLPCDGLHLVIDTATKNSGSRALPEVAGMVKTRRGDCVTRPTLNIGADERRARGIGNLSNNVVTRRQRHQPDRLHLGARQWDDDLLRSLRSVYVCVKVARPRGPPSSSTSVLNPGGSFGGSSGPSGLQSGQGIPGLFSLTAKKPSALGSTEGKVGAMA